MPLLYKTFPRVFLLICPALYCLLSTWSSSPAWADKSVYIVTESDTDYKELLRSNAHAALSESGYVLGKESDARSFRKKETLNCLEEAGNCAELTHQSGARWLLIITMRKNPTSGVEDFAIAAKLYSSTEARLEQVGQRICESCSSKERLASIVTELITEIIESQLSQEGNDTFLTVQSSPSGALLKIDGQVVGRTGESYRVKPGEHQIEIQAEGHTSISQNISLEPNENKSLRIQLSPDSGSGKTTPWMGLAALGGGGLALGLGAYWVAIDGDSTDSGEARDKIYATNTQGIVAGVAGVALVSAGIYLWLTHDNSDSKQETANYQWGVAPHSQGWSVGLSGNF